MAKIQEKPHLPELVHQMTAVALAPSGYHPEVVMLTLEEVGLSNLRERHFWRDLRAYFNIYVDERRVYTSESSSDNATAPKWRFSEPLKIRAYPSSTLKFTICRDGKVRGTQILGIFEAPLYVFLSKYDGSHGLKSGDSPGSRLMVRMNADLDCDFQSYGLAIADRQLSDAEEECGSAGLLGPLAHSITALGQLGKHFVQSHPVLKAAAVMLATVYKTLTAHIEVVDEVKSLALELHGLLHEANRYRGSKQTEDCIRDIILLAMECASLIDKWSQTCFILKSFTASDVIVQINNCKEKLEKIRVPFSMAGNFHKLENDLSQINVKLDDHFIEIRSGLAQIMSYLALYQS